MGKFADRLKQWSFQQSTRDREKVRHEVKVKLAATEDLTTQFEKLAEALKTLPSFAEAMKGTSMAATTADPRLEWFKTPTYRSTDGKLRWGKRLENRTSRHAEYTVTVTEKERLDPSKPDEKFVVERVYGPIGAPGHRQVITTTPDLMAALAQAKSIVRGKTSRRDYDEVAGWEDIEGDASVSDSEPETWELTEEFLPADEPVQEPVEPPSRECACVDLFTEIGSRVTEVIEGTPEVAPKLSNEQSALLELPAQVGARWVVGVYANCAPGYPHVRAVPVGPDLTNADIAPLLRRNSPEWVEDIVLKFLRPETVRRMKSFALLVEESGPNLIAIDLLYGQVPGEKHFANVENIVAEDDFRLRRSFLTEIWPNTFNATDVISLVPLRIARLREEFLSNDGTKRFELVDQTMPLPMISVRLPVL